MRTRSLVLGPAVMVVLAVFSSCDCGNNHPNPGDAGTCAAPKTTCSNSCVDTRLDDANCGMCGHACGADKGCAGSQCYPKQCGSVTCPDSSVCVGGLCVDKSCFGVICPSGQACAGGACYPTMCNGMTCPVGQVCVDATTGCEEADCVGVICPGGAQCKNGACTFDTCGDQVQNGSETDVDCGGSCPACASGLKCAASSDCQSLDCKQALCAAPTCSDGIRNGDEGDIDCGGSCPLCATGKTCSMGSQCQSGVCNNLCQAPSCSDGVKNGTETDTDCGSNCPACGDGKACMMPADCQSGHCTMNQCVQAQCLNGAQDPGETDIDCGGPCVPCGTSKKCLVATDCQSMVCDSTMHCAAASCTDMVKNGTESDTDCGGSCPPCNAGQACFVGTDCATLVCGTNSKCSAVSCSDGVKNGNETDVDCGGPTACGRCGANKSCAMNSDCASNLCTNTRCTTPAVFGTARTYTMPNPRNLVATDIDGDGKIDLLVSDLQSYTVTLLWNEGDGGFNQVAGPSYSGVVMGQGVGGPAGIAVGDVNADGINDLIAAREYAPFGNPMWCILTIANGAGSRGFFAATDYVDSTSSAKGCGESVASGRLDPDGFWDVVLGQDTNENAVSYQWMGGAAPIEQPLGSEPGSMVALADVNSDGALDLVSHRSKTSAASVALGRGDGGFALPLVMAVSPGFGQIVAGDYDNDGIQDIAMACDQSGVISLARGLNDGGFLAPTSVASGGGPGVAIGDFDRDGKNDFVSSGGVLYVLHGLGNGQFSSPDPYGNGAVGGTGRLVAADFNGDGKPDVAMIYPGSGVVEVYLNQSP